MGRVSLRVWEVLFLTRSFSSWAKTDTHPCSMSLVHLTPFHGGDK